MTTAGPLVEESVEMLLEARFEYYKKLNPEDKQKFLRRVLEFAKDKEFIPRDELNISDNLDDIRTLISAAGVQLTFGLEQYMLPHFSKIFIYPQEYYNRMTHHWHKGEANVVGALVFSWKDFKEGYADDHDKLNLGLHEMGHALMLTTNIDEGRDPFFAPYFPKWWAVSNAEFQKLENHEKSFFRDYGGTDPQEFFAVVVEHFFEAASEFKEKHPEIYRQTCILLNQDPSGDFNKITTARVNLLHNETDTTAQNLIYRTKGRSFAHLTYSLGLTTVFVSILLASGSSAFSPALMITIVTALAFVAYLSVRYISYREFYVYENAFGVGYERHGEDLDKMTILPALTCISIEFKIIALPKGGRAYLLEVLFTNDGKMIKKDWNYEHIRTEQVTQLKQAVKDYCAKNRIGFKDMG